MTNAGSRSAKPCIEPGCPRLTRAGSRCPEHERLVNQRRDQLRGSRYARGYDNHWMQLSKQVLERDGYACAYCGGLATTVDHVLPKAKGGSDDPGNLVAACARCNSRKGAR